MVQVFTGLETNAYEINRPYWKECTDLVFICLSKWYQS